FQPSSIIATGPRITAFLLGNIKDVSLNVRTVFPSNVTNALRVNLQLNKSLHLCGDNETDCCPKPLCVLESLQVSACVGNTVQASLLIQAKIHANQTVIPNQVYEPLGSCPCDLTARTCDIRCCCDKQDCSPEELKLFQSHCHPGPFGGQRPPVPDYHCSARRDNSPDWFPFLCVISPPENNPYLGLFYNGDKIPKPRPSFQIPVLSEPVFNIYRQGNPIFTLDDQLFTIPQMAIGHCVDNAPVAFLENFSHKCVNLLNSCPTAFPLQTLASDLRVRVNNGQGDKVTLALDYTFYWKRNHITNVNLIRSVGTVIFKGSKLTTRYSAVFLTRDYVGESNSGNPGLCFTAEKQPVLFAMNSTSGCHLHVSLQNLTQCDLLATVGSLQTNLITATYVAKKGNPNSEKEADWVKFQINFTEYDCNKNDVCWPHLAFPLTKYYTEPHSQALAKGLILLFFFIAASLLGTPWRQIRQAW
uniref:Tectonic family member 2 n=1 Tax=Hippocampus comes TaxID=109280 RepID=A0A3Q2XUN8_HIPCM